MLKNFLKRWGPVLMFVIVLGLSVGLVYMNLTDPKTDPDIITAKANQAAVDKALSAGKVSPDFIASPENAAKLKFSEEWKQNTERIKRTVDEPIGVFVSYPQPSRPKSEPPPPPPSQDDIFAKMPIALDQTNPSFFKAIPERGKIFVRCELPTTGYELMEPLRFEIFRGLAANKIDITKPWGTIEIGLEKSPAKAGAAAAGTPAAAAEATENSRVGRIRGTVGTAPVPAPGDRSKKPAEKEYERPASKYVFVDAKDIDQQTTYFYQVRLVAKFTSVEGKKVPGTKPDGTAKEVTHHAPNNPALTPVKATEAGVRLYATPMTTSISAKTPTNFQIRISSITGTVPPIGAVRNPAAPKWDTFKVNFEVRAWIQDAGKWVTARVENIAEGDTIGGTIKYDKKEYPFTKDLNFKLYEVNNEEIVSAIGGRKIVAEVTYIEDLRSKEKIKLLKTDKFTNAAQDEEIKECEKIVAAQEKELKKLKDMPPAAPTPAPAPAAPPAAPATPPAK